MDGLESKLAELNRMQKNFGRAAVAYSGGVDSSLLLKLARDCLGRENVLAITAVSPLLSRSEQVQAGLIARMIDASHLMIDSAELRAEEVAANSPDRCYHCKRIKLALLGAVAAGHGFDCVLEGSNLSDTLDYRPGMRALKENDRVCSPFLECSLDKSDIRLLAKQLGLPNWDSPAQACLASRIPYGTRIDEKMLASVADAEASLRQLGFSNVRVRHHGDIARIEIEPSDFALLQNETARKAAVKMVMACGFKYAALDLEGYRSGSLNEALDELKRV